MTTKRTPLDQLIEQFYEGILVEGGWTEALKSLTGVSGSGQASILVMDRHTKAAHVHEHSGIPEEVFTEYNVYFHRHDTALEIATRIPCGQWYYDRRDLGESIMRRSEFYQDFMRRHGESSVIANHLLNDTSMECYLSCQRMIGQPQYGDSDFRRMEKLIPHVQRAVRIRMRMQALADRAGLGKIMLDRLRVPLLAVDDTGRVLLANTEAEAVMRRKPALTVQNGRLAVKGLAAGKLEQLLRAACGIDGPAIAGGAHLPGQANQVSLQIVVAPLPAHLHFFHAWSRPLALVMVHDPDMQLTSQELLLQQLYGLTPAESRAAMSLLRGATPAQAAQEAGVGIATVRSQLKAVYAKMGITRQADLIRMLSSILAIGN